MAKGLGSGGVQLGVIALSLINDVTRAPYLKSQGILSSSRFPQLGHQPPSNEVIAAERSEQCLHMVTPQSVVMAWLLLGICHITWNAFA